MADHRIPDPAVSASQDVSIIAADQKQFSDALAAIDEIYTKFGLEYASGALKRNGYESFEGEPGITFGTRYFTPSHVCKNNVSEKLSVAIDPYGILTKAVGGRGKHLQDNMVLYHEHKPEYTPSK